MRVSDIKIGILAVTAEGAAKAFRDMTVAFYEAFGAYNNPHILMNMQPLSAHVENFGDKEKWTGLVQAGFDSLRDRGAHIAWMPANSSHLVVNDLFFGDMVFVNMVDASIERMAIMKGRPLVLGTNVSLSDKLYFRDPAALKNFVRPDEDERARINEIILKELILGKMSVQSRSFVKDLVVRYRQNDNIDNLFLACTELPCFFDRNDFAVPVDDSISVGIKAVISHVQSMVAGSDE